MFKSINLLSLLFAVSSIRVQCGNIRTSDPVAPPVDLPPLVAGSPGESVLPSSAARSLYAETRRVVPETYFRNGKFEPLYAGPPFPISVETHVVRGGFVKVTLKAINVINYEITYNNADGWVSNVRPTGQTQHTGTPDQMATEAKLKNIIANSHQIAFENDGRIQFITDNGTTRISFDRLIPASPVAAPSVLSFPGAYPSPPYYGTYNHFGSSYPVAYDSHSSVVETRYVVPETYFRNGKFEPLYVGHSYPISVDVNVVRGGFVKVTLKAINIINYEITYNNADGWVSNVRPIGQTQHAGTPDQMATESKLKNVIANSQQIAFESDGRMQFITDNGTTRISFDRARSRDLATVETRYVAPETYMHHGRFQSLYDGQSFPITVDTERRYGTSLIVTLKAVKTVQFELTYNNSNGWVSHVKQLGETSMPGVLGEAAAEKKVRYVIANCQQIAFESNGRIHFIADDGHTRISFDRLIPASPVAAPSIVPYPGSYPSPPYYGTYNHFGSAYPVAYNSHNPVVETRRVVPESYFRNGKFEPLYTGPPFPISVETHVVRGGFVKVTLKAINMISYEITYNNADGWVSDVRLSGQTQDTGTPDQMATEAKLKNIIANSQQIAFENDGRIQFITDNGTARISFVV